MLHTSRKGDADIENQYPVDSTKKTSKTSWRETITAYTILFVAIVFYFFLIMGVMVLTDWLIPTALPSYNKLKELGAELANAKFELAGLQAQMKILYQAINHVGSVEKAGE